MLNSVDTTEWLSPWLIHEDARGIRKFKGEHTNKNPVLLRARRQRSPEHEYLGIFAKILKLKSHDMIAACMIEAIMRQVVSFKLWRSHGNCICCCGAAEKTECLLPKPTALEGGDNRILGDDVGLKLPGIPHIFSLHGYNYST